MPAALQTESDTLQKIQQLEQERFFSRVASYNQRNPRAKFFFAGIGAISVFLALQAKWKKSSVETEIERRKVALSAPVVQISDQNGTSFPWSPQNIENWLHKPVQITGRQLHNRVIAQDSE